jgi:hypothetical protein
MHTKFWLGILNGRGHSEYLGMYRWEDNTKMVFREIGSEGVDWIYLAEDRDQCWALVNTLMSLQVL